MRPLLMFIASLATGLLLATPASVSADDGCARALAATAGTPGQAFVQAHCAQSTTRSETPATTSPAAGAQAAVQGCAKGLAAAAGTPGAPFVQAACDRLAEQVGVPVPVAPSPPATDNGCAIAEQMTRDTPGHAWVVVECGRTDGGATAGAEDVSAGCDLAIQAVLNTVAEPFVRAGCAQAVAGAAAGAAGNDESADTSQAPDSPEDGGDGDLP
jgi:uncharacterized protein YceK